jgi:hypothetical protein
MQRQQPDNKTAQSELGKHVRGSLDCMVEKCRSRKNQWNFISMSAQKKRELQNIENYRRL